MCNFKKFNEMIDLKEFRKVNFLTQKEIADYFGVGQGFISQIEKGNRPLPKEYISRLLANPHGWDVSMLLEGDQPENAVAETPETGAITDKLLALIEDLTANNKTLLAMLKDKDEKIEALQEELRALREHKGETARTAGDSSVADAV